MASEWYQVIGYEVVIGGGEAGRGAWSAWALVALIIVRGSRHATCLFQVRFD